MYLGNSTSEMFFNNRWVCRIVSMEEFFSGVDMRPFKSPRLRRGRVKSDSTSNFHDKTNFCRWHLMRLRLIFKTLGPLMKDANLRIIFLISPSLYQFHEICTQASNPHAVLSANMLGIRIILRGPQGIAEYANMCSNFLPHHTVMKS